VDKIIPSCCPKSNNPPIRLPGRQSFQYYLFCLDVQKWSSFNGEGNRQGKSTCLVFLKTPESSWFPISATVNHTSTTYRFLFILPQRRCGRIVVAHGTKWGKLLRGLPSLSTDYFISWQKAFFIKKKNKTQNTKKYHNKNTCFKVNMTFCFSLCNTTYILFCKFMFLQNCCKVVL